MPPPENTGASATNQTLLALNCDAQLASAKAPGNSLASPQGQAAAASAAAKAPRHSTEQLILGRQGVDFCAG